MITMAFDTTAKSASIAVLDGERALAVYSIDNGLTQSELLLPMAEDVLRSLKLTFSDVGLYACSVGPGSFTGVRIGVSTVKGLAFGRDKVCVEVSTIEALAANLEGFEGIICPVMNARRGQVYTGIFKGENRLMDAECMMLADLAPMLENYGEKIYFVGDGYDLAIDYKIKNTAHTPECLRYANAYSVGKVAYKKLTKGEGVSDAQLRVNYLRKPQAEREREERLKSEGKL